MCVLCVISSSSSSSPLCVVCYIIIITKDHRHHVCVVCYIIISITKGHRHHVNDGTEVCWSGVILPKVNCSTHSLKGACSTTTVQCSRRQLCCCCCCCCCILLLRFYGWAAILLCLAVVGYRQRMLYREGGPFYRSRVQYAARVCGCNQPVVCCCWCILLLRI